MNWLESLHLATLSAVVLLAPLPIIGHPPWALCKCDAFPGRHHKSALILLMALCAISTGFLLLAITTFGPSSVIPATITILLGAWHLWLWWKHTKRNRRKLLDKALGVVRATAAGLKIHPVPAGAAA